MRVIGALVWRRERIAGRVRRAALRYAAHGWPVVPGAYAGSARGTHTCEQVGCVARGTHPAVADWPAAATVDCLRIAEWWGHGDYLVVLPTGAVFDVLEVTADFGAAVRGLLVDARGRPAVPMAAAPNGRWYLVVGPGAPLRPELASRAGVMLHGAGSWMLAPPSALSAGRVRWLVSPDAVDWQPPDPRAVQDTLVSFLRRRTR